MSAQISLFRQRTQGNHSLKTIAFAAIAIVIALFIGVEIGSANYKPVVLSILIVVGMWLVFFTGEYFWIITIASGSLAGTFPVLGGSFTPFQMLMAIGVVKFFVEDIVLRRKRIRPGPLFDRWMIFGFMAVVTLHAFHDRFGMRFLGSTVWGGRNYVNLYVALAAFFVLQTVSIGPAIWRRIPYFTLAVCSFDLLVAVVTTVAPNLIYVIYPFYSAVSRTGVEELTTQATGVDTTRLGSVGNFGVLLLVLTLASIPWRRIVDPAKLTRLLTLIVAWVCIFLSSFRSSVFSGLAVMLVAALRDLRLRAFIVLPITAAAVLLGLSFFNSYIAPLPRAMQRSLTFIPGKWDSIAKEDADDSNKWRGEIWDMWMRDYFPQHPWVGRGYGFRSEWGEPSVLHYRPADNRAAIEVGNVHNGLFSALDNVGIVGTIFFIVWSIGVFIRILKLRFDSRLPTNTVMWFMALGIGASIICYWGGAQTSGDFMAHQFIGVSVLLRVQQIFTGSRTENGSISTDERTAGT